MNKVEVSEIHAMTALYVLRLALQEKLLTSDFEIASIESAIEDFKGSIVNKAVTK